MSDVLEFLQDVISLVDVYLAIKREVEGSKYTQNTRQVYTQILYTHAYSLHIYP